MYRPSSFQEIIGQRLTATVLGRMAERDQVPDGLLLSGPSGTGKTSVARVLAAALDADTIEVDGASRGGVAEVRALIETTRYGFAGKHRVVIVDECQSISKEGFNAFLKTLEEPPNGTIFIFCTTEPEKIPRTVRTRLIEFEFRKVSPHEIYERLQHIAEAEGIEAAPELLSSIANRVDGSVRSAVMLLDQVRRAEVSTQAEFDAMLGHRDTAPYLLAAMVQGNREKVFRVLDHELGFVGSASVITAQLIRLLRDITVLHGGGDLELSGPPLDHRNRLAARTAPDDIYALARVLWTLKVRVRVDDDPRGNLELAVMLMLDTLTRATERNKIPQSAEVITERRVTLAEIQKRGMSQ